MITFILQKGFFYRQRFSREGRIIPLHYKNKKKLFFFTLIAVETSLSAPMQAKSRFILSSASSISRNDLTIPEPFSSPISTTIIYRSYRILLHHKQAALESVYGETFSHNSLRRSKPTAFFIIEEVSRCGYPNP